MDAPDLAYLEQRIDELEQALYTIAGAVRYAHYSPRRALATVGRVVAEALGPAALPAPDDAPALEGLRPWVLYRTIEDLRLGDGGAAVLVLGDGHALVLRPVVMADGRACLLPELRAQQDVD